MNFYYFDTNAFIKLLLPQRGHDILKEVFEKDDSVIIVSNLCIAEVHSALQNQKKGGKIKLSQYKNGIELFDSIIEKNKPGKIRPVLIDRDAYEYCIPLIEKHALHTLDALHFYTVLKYKSLDITFVTEDKKLKKAAVNENIKVLEFERCICNKCGSLLKQENETIVCKECNNKKTTYKMICPECKNECSNCIPDSCKIYNLDYWQSEQSNVVNI